MAKSHSNFYKNAQSEQMKEQMGLVMPKDAERDAFLHHSIIAIFLKNENTFF